MGRTRCHRRLLIALLVAAMPSVHAQPAEPFDQASRSARIAGASLSKVHRWLHDAALPRIDPETGLYRADGKWNYRDTAADCYPFFAWAAFVVDKPVLNGPVRQALHAEMALCNTEDRIPIPWDFDRGATVEDFSYDAMVFEASEYVKDGLIAIVEATGRDEWFDRMREIEDDLWKGARVETSFGPILSTNIEVNGEQLQALCRLYTMTGDTRYLEWAERLADYHLSDDTFVPRRLRDHGCEIIGGLGLLLAVESERRPEKARSYAARLKRVFDTILATGCNEDGIMYNRLGESGDAALSDGWGYNYVGYLCYDLAVGADTYTPGIRATLANLAKPLYKDYPWERDNIDGWADSIEGGLYVLNRLPVAEGLAWADREMGAHVARTDEPEHLWGTMKLESNGVRTTIIHALMHTQGIIARPWRAGLEVGAAPCEGGVAVVLRSGEDYEGVLDFDIPRHRLYLGFRKDWPRMNTIPEWFTVEPDRTYTVRRDGVEEAHVRTGRQLHNGLAVKVARGETLRLRVKAAP